MKLAIKMIDRTHMESDNGANPNAEILLKQCVEMKIFRALQYTLIPSKIIVPKNVHKFVLEMR